MTSPSTPAGAIRDPRSRAVVAVLLLLAVLAAAGVLAAPARAHDTLIAADPPDGAVLSEAPAHVALTFSGEPLELSPVVVVSDASGAAVTAGAPAVVGRNVRLDLPPALPDGDYTVAWRVVSADGHPIEGSHSFAVAAGDAPPAPDGGATAAPAPDVAPPTGPPPTSEPGTALAALPTWLKVAVAVAALGSVAGLVVLVARQLRDRD